MTTRRGFFSRAGAALSAMLLPVPAAATDPRVPPRMDIREGDNPFTPIEVRRHGVPLRYVVAYDLDGDWATVYRCDPNGVPLIAVSKFQYETLRGGITVVWTQPPP